MKIGGKTNSERKILQPIGKLKRTDFYILFLKSYVNFLFSILDNAVSKEYGIEITSEFFFSFSPYPDISRL
jgi:hypothetical protein